MTAGRDFYKILGVPRDADEDALKKAYKKQAAKYHPDKHANKSEKGVGGRAVQGGCAEAFEVLSDKDKALCTIATARTVSRLAAADAAAAAVDAACPPALAG